MDDDRRASLGAVIRTLREANGLSREQLAEKAEISGEMLAKVEQGRKSPSAGTLAKIAKALGIEAPDLAHRAYAWEAVAATGASQAAMRAGVISGALGIRRGAMVAAPFIPAVGVAAMGAMVASREIRNRRVIEELLRSNLDLSREDLEDIAGQLGVDIPGD